MATDNPQLFKGRVNDVTSTAKELIEDLGRYDIYDYDHPEMIRSTVIRLVHECHELIQLGYELK